MTHVPHVTAVAARSPVAFQQNGVAACRPVHDLCILLRWEAASCLGLLHRNMPVIALALGGPQHDACHMLTLRNHNGLTVARRLSAIPHEHPFMPLAARCMGACRGHHLA